MKKITLYCLLLFGLGFISCNKNKKNDTDQVLTEKPVSTQCYIALYELDTINLKINILNSGKISGDMNMKLENKPLKMGDISGEFRGDTLFVDYSFTQEPNNKVKFKNPMAFLKSGNELILGNGKILTYLGASYFAKGEPIDFVNIKYKFKPVDCIQK